MTPASRWTVVWAAFLAVPLVIFAMQVSLGMMMGEADQRQIARELAEQGVAIDPSAATVRPQRDLPPRVVAAWTAGRHGSVALVEALQHRRVGQVVVVTGAEVTPTAWRREPLAWLWRGPIFGTADDALTIADRTQRYLATEALEDRP